MEKADVTYDPRLLLSHMGVDPRYRLGSRPTHLRNVGTSFCSLGRMCTCMVSQRVRRPPAFFPAGSPFFKLVYEISLVIVNGVAVASMYCEPISPQVLASSAFRIIQYAVFAVMNHCRNQQSTGSPVLPYHTATFAPKSRPSNSRSAPSRWSASPSDILSRDTIACFRI